MTLARCRSALLALFGASLLPCAFGQAGPPPAVNLEGISGCSLQGSEVFVSTGQGAEQRRYKYPWDASIDALCNAKGFAMGSPARATPAIAPQAPSAAGGGDFPADATPLSADAVSKKIAGKTFGTQLKDGTRVRLEYKANGYMFVNAGGGYSNSGPWRAEESRICSQLKNAAASCNEIREQGQQIHLKRDNGEVIILTPQ